MKIGMLWYNNDPKMLLDDKIKAALEYYRNKYGRVANCCYTNPATLGNKKVNLAGVEVHTSRSVLPNHFWIGVADV